MTDPQEATENIGALSHSEGEPDPTKPRESTGTDVGGPGPTSESAAEQALTDTSTVGADDEEPGEGSAIS